jgi:3-deoxy-D-manno-octulosonate 8-phosphate phosphatase (KDO 8-P phosphatase)
MKKNIPKYFLLDVDGVMTSGKFTYSQKGKIYKEFGPDDADALNVLRRYLKIQFITSDHKGFKISKKRISNDMGFDLNLVPTFKRLAWVKKRFNLKQTIFMGDGIFDYLLMKETFFSICPNNSSSICKKYAKYQTKSKGGNRAVAEACLFILKKFFNKKIEDIFN